MADKKITDFDPFNGVANDKVFFVVASGEGSNPLSKNYKYDYKNLSADIIAGSSYWVSAPSIDSLYTLTGAVGIGTSIPAHKLDVAGTISGYTGKFKDGIFSNSLTISGVAVSTGIGGKWHDAFRAGDIYYNGGTVGVGDYSSSIPTSLGPTAPAFAVKGGSSNEGISIYNSAGDIRHRQTVTPLDEAEMWLYGADDAPHVKLFGKGEAWFEQRVTSQTGTFSKSLTISGVSVATGMGGKWEDAGGGGDIYYDGGNVAIGNVPALTPLARLHVTGGDNRILAPSGAFTESLTVSGVPVSTGAGGAGKWIDDPAYALGIAYEDGPVGISGDLRVSGSGYFSSNTLLIGEDISLKAADDYLTISGSGIRVGDPGSEDIVLTTEKMGLGTTADLAEEPSDINFKLLTDQNRFVVGTTGQPGGDLSGWYRFNDYTVKGASDMGAHIMNPVDTRIYTQGTSFMVLTEDSAGGPVGYIANGSNPISANNAIAIGIAPKLDEAETPRDLEFTDTDGEAYSVINGDSDSVGINGLPLSQGLQAPSMGAAPAALLIDGGYF